ncbi:transcriptional activator, TenA family [Kribbella flavida DSM 17836]|uniref:Transcriptional activator, TenA family n=1 Tax=Kribbella flavida (strain DSM 17836 / JCM 10339 / NBRC 14399) TaxID=479435 RepID=D2PZT2_KRIFD|nr:transcriptional activator, TenA family [Kribbella flavida]ADB35648.1 transcriptional activator, TenA family [Kribbella flavida DSM 17836]
MGETASKLVSGQQAAWTQILMHPFVARTSDGSLPRSTFDRWLVEDYYFVGSFQVYLRELSAIAPDQQARDVLAGGLAALEPELALFEKAADERGLELAGEPSLLNLGYSSYLLSTLREGWPVAITVLYAVEKAYYDAWASVRERTGADTQYAGFIANWSSPEFAAYVEQLAGLVDREDLTPEMALAFDRVIRFELAFWDLVHG